MIYDEVISAYFSKIYKILDMASFFCCPMFMLYFLGEFFCSISGVMWDKELRMMVSRTETIKILLVLRGESHWKQLVLTSMYKHHAKLISFSL
jgi:hypothetical protein